MGSNLDLIKDKLNNGEIPLGTVVTFNDPEIADLLCNCGFDFIWIDSEHGPLDKNMINMHIMAVRGAGAAPFVRIAWNDPVLAKPILDMGPAGIIFPFIRSAEEARQAVSSCKYPPQGIRGYGPRRSSNFANMDTEDYLNTSRSEPWVIIQIEHIDGVKNLDDIIKVEGVDMIAVGTNDLSGSIGLLGQAEHPEVIKLLDIIAAKCKKAGMRFFPAIGSGCEKTLKDWIKRGACMLAIDYDLGYLVSGAKNALNYTRQIIYKSKNK